jgi:undecaprenyl diphosphate synthase
MSEIEGGPDHVAIIMDGNGRWAKERGFIRSIGHERGGNQVRDILRAAHHLGIKQLTLYAFSSENWKRPAAEVKFLHELLVKFLKSETEQLNQDNVHFKTIGELSRFPQKVQREIQKSKDALANNDGIVLCLALNYGSRAEIVNAAQKLMEESKRNPDLPNQVTEEMFSSYLETADMPEVDLLIRTAGEQRISNFLLWQVSYSEFYFTDAYWPDFSPDHLKAALEEYCRRHRRFGGL